jgi:hypothetical protein
MPDWKQQGTHRYYLEEDFVYWESHGPILAADMLAALTGLDQVYQRSGYSIGIFDARDKATVTPEARRLVAAHGRQGSEHAATVIIGAGPILRTMMSLLHNAYRLFSKSAPSTYYCATVDEAWQRVAEERRRLRTLPTAS